MERTRRNLTIQRKLATQEYRGKSPHVKGLKLLEDLDIFKKEAADAVSLSSRSINRAIRAKTEGRDLGRNGKPPIFSQEDTDELLRLLYLLRESTPLTMKIVQEQVRMMNYINLMSNFSIIDAQILDQS